MLAKKFEHLINGGGAAMGIEGLQVEIIQLTGEMNKYRAELGEMPDQRAELILADNNAAALDKLEFRERDLYRSLEKAEMQLAALQTKIADLRDAEIQPRIEYHRSAVASAVATADAAILEAVQAHHAVIAALENGRRELGADKANTFLRFTHFVGFLNDQCLNNWREHQNLKRQGHQFGTGD